MIKTRGEGTPEGKLHVSVKFWCRPSIPGIWHLRGHALDAVTHFQELPFGNWTGLQTPALVVS